MPQGICRLYEVGGGRGRAGDELKADELDEIGRGNHWE